MRKTLILTATIAALALGACGEKGGEANGTAGTGKNAQSAAGKAAEMAFRFQPGQYRTTVEVQNVTMPGMPAAAQDQMRSMFAKGMTSEYCLKPEDAAKGIEQMKAQMARGDCQFETFDASGGTVKSAFTCKNEGMEMRSTSEGTYSDTGSQVAIVADMKGPGGQGMHIAQTVKTERIGDCK